MKKPCLTLVLLILLAIAVATYATYIQIHYHDRYHTFAWDLGLFIQSLESFVFHGKLFYNTVELPFNPTGSYFGIHFSPILFLFAIPYAIYPQPVTLFFTKNFLICLASPVLYKIGVERGLSRGRSALIATAYLFFLPLYGPLTTEFHPYSVFPLFISLTHLYAMRHDHRKALFATFLGLSTNEVAAVLYIFYAIGLLVTGPKDLAKRMILISTAWFLVAFAVILFLNPIQWQYYFNQHLLKPISQSLLSPDGLIALKIHTISFFMMTYGLLLFLPLASPLEGILAIIPWMVFATISTHIPYSSPYYQYSSLIASQLFIAVINASKKLQKFRIIAPILFILNLLSVIVLGPMGFGGLDYVSDFPRPRSFNTTYRFNLMHVETPNREALDGAIKMIPENASVLVQNHIFPHVSKRLNSYVSLIPGVTGWPIIYEGLDLKEIEYISLFSTPDNRMKFLGVGEVVEISLNSEKLVVEDGASTVKLNRPTEIRRLVFKCRLKTENVEHPQVILSSEAFELGIATNGYLVLLIRNKHGEDAIQFSDEPLRPMKVYEVEAYVTPHEVLVKLDKKTLINIAVRNRVVSWLVDNVEYVILDSSASISNFRIGDVPLVLGPEYGLVAAGDGVMVFSKIDVVDRVHNLTRGKYMMYIYASDEPLGEAIATMSLSRLMWKPVNQPLAPHCVFLDLRSELFNVSVSGVEEHAFAKPAEKAYLINNMSIRCSAIIRGEIDIPSDGYYAFKVVKMVPSSVDIKINGKLVNADKPIYLSSGKHEIEVTWKKIRYPLLKIELENISQLS